VPVQEWKGASSRLFAKERVRGRRGVCGEGILSFDFRLALLSLEKRRTPPPFSFHGAVRLVMAGGGVSETGVFTIICRRKKSVMGFADRGKNHYQSF